MADNVRYFTRDASFEPTAPIGHLLMLDADGLWFQWWQGEWRRLDDAAAEGRWRAIAIGSDILMTEVTKDRAEEVRRSL